MEAFSGATRGRAPRGHDPTPLAACPVCRQVFKVRTVCVSSASTDLCRGCRATGIPTATRVGSQAEAWFRTCHNIGMFRFVWAFIALAPLVAEERVDLAAINQIKNEAFENSKVMDHLSFITDMYGP